MTHATGSAADRRAAQLAADYARQGYRVVMAPGPEALPFDLGGFRPDLLAHRGDEHVLVGVRGPGDREMERVRQALEEVRAHPGWRLVLVAREEPEVGGPAAGRPRLLSWDELRDRLRSARQVLAAGEPAGAFLTLWATLEGILRRRAEGAGLPLERMPTGALLDHAYSYGELSIPQYDRARAVVEVRNRLVHGFSTPDVAAAAECLATLVEELLDDVPPHTAAA